jgi:hypothetical protein
MKAGRSDPVKAEREMKERREQPRLRPPGEKNKQMKFGMKNVDVDGRMGHEVRDRRR